MVEKREPRAELLPGALVPLILKSPARGSMHGYNIAGHIPRTSEDVLRVEEGALYPALHRLELRGLLASDWGLSKEQPARQVLQVDRCGEQKACSTDRALVPEGERHLALSPLRPPAASNLLCSPLAELKIRAFWRIVNIESYRGTLMLRHITCSLVVGFLACISAFAQAPLSSDKQTTPASASDNSPSQPKVQIADLEKRPKISKNTRMQIIQAINAEFARTRKTFPIGDKDITLTTDGKVRPGDDRLYQMAMTYGVAAKIGDRIQISNIVIRDKSIYFEINGGPKKKGHWYQHVTISGSGGGVVPGGSDPNQGAITGAAFTLEFKNHVPEMTGPELKQLLDPVFDFSTKTATEVYLETVPPKVKEAIKKHEVLVGMNHDMVVMAKDRPPKKDREKDQRGVEYEEWIYGEAPQDVTFVRFVGDEVTQVKIMKVGGEEVLRTEKEVDVKDGVVTLAAATAASVSAASGENQAPQQSGPRPTLKRPGDVDDSSTNKTSAPPAQPRSTTPSDYPSEIPPGGQPLPPAQPQPPGSPPNF